MAQISWEDRLRAACNKWPGSTYALAKQSGIDEGQLRRFIAGQQSCGIETAERLGRVVGLDLIDSEPEEPKIPRRK